MTPKFSLVTAIAGAALVFAVPAALGEGRLAGSLDPAMAKAMAEDGFDHAVAAKLALQSKVGGYRDANERPSATKPVVQSSLSGYRDAFERAVPPAGSAEFPTISSGRGLEWPQIGVGFGVGILLALGLVLAFRHTRIRPLAH